MKFNFLQDDYYIKWINKYQTPFSVRKFVEKYEIQDSNGSECKNIEELVEWALNKISKAAKEVTNA